MSDEAFDRVSLRALKCFERVATLGSFSAAGRQMNMPRAGISRIIQQVETTLGVSLFQRTTRAVLLTEEGRQLLKRIRPSVETLSDALSEAGTSGTQPAGVVRFSVSQAFARRYVLPCLPAFQRQNPGVRVEVVVAEAIDDLVQEGLDFSIRQGVLPDSAIISRKVVELDLVLAVPVEFLSAGAELTTIAEMVELPSVGFRVPGSRTLLRWQFENEGKIHVHVPEPATLVVDSVEGVADLVNAGAGIAPLPFYLVEESLRTRRLVVGLRGFRMPKIPVHVCFAGRGPRLQRVQLLVDHIIEAVRAECRVP